MEAGQQVEVVLELDLGTRTVDVPDALVAALATDPAAEKAFERISFTHRKEYARWISEAKRDETRQRRVQRALEMIKAGKHRS